MKFLQKNICNNLVGKVLTLALALLVLNGSRAYAQFQEAYNITKRGLNYVQVSNKLGQRESPKWGFMNGLAQPAAFTVSGIPAGAIIEKAFIFTGSSGNGAQLTATITTPSAMSHAVQLVNVGNDVDKCWGYASTSSYQGDITALIEGNGNYFISGLPVGFPNEVDGATLMVIYSEPTASYIGTFVIANGIFTRQGGGANYTLGNFTAASNATAAKAFSIISDLEVPSTVVTLNGAIVPDQYSWWNYFESNTTVTAGQNSSNFAVFAAGDCYSWLASGLYYQVANPLSIAIDNSSVNDFLCKGANFNLAFTTTGTYLNGNEFIAQLSDATGSFANPVVIGSLAGTGSGAINVTIPGSTALGSGYRLRVVSSNPAQVSAQNATDLTIVNLPQPTITSTYINPAQINNINEKVIFLGHGSQKMQLNAGNLGGASVAWKQVPGLDPTKLNITNPVFAPTSEGLYTLTLTATNLFGCSTTTTERITVIDAICGTKGDKVLVCHNGKEICVSQNALQALIAQPNTRLGFCNQDLTEIGRIAQGTITAKAPESTLTIYPNPFNSKTTVEFTLNQNGNYRAELLDMKGQLVKVIANEEGTAGKVYSKELSSTDLAAGMYLVRLVSASEVKYLKLLLDK